MNTQYQLFKSFGLALIFSLGCLLSGCATGETYGKSDGAYATYVNAKDAIPKSEALDPYANPSTYVVAGRRYHVLKTAKGYDKVGYASWYGTKFHGKRTFNNERYNMYSMTAASTTLPIPSYVRVTNLDNGRSAIVKINDRGPFKSNRIIDLSYAAAKKLDYTGRGTALVRVTAVDTGASSKEYFHANKPLQLAQAHSNRYLQVGTFKTRNNAVHLSKQISAITKADVSVESTHQNQKIVYQVHIGPLANDSQTAKIKAILMQHGFEKLKVITG